MGRIYAEYHARDWAAGRTDDEIKAEIERVDTPKTRDWQEVGCAADDYVRSQTLRQVLIERGSSSVA